MKVNVDLNNEIVLGTLSEGKCDQMLLDLVFDRDFTISHNSKSSSVYICGYRTGAPEGNYSVVFILAAHLMVSLNVLQVISQKDHVP